MIDYENFKKIFMYYFNEYDIAFNEKIINDFYIFTEYLLSENKKYNLTSITDIDEIIVKHYIDSVIIFKYFEIPENSKIIDIGAGAGFPALPLSIMRKDLKITFLDSSHKKINFIKNAATGIIRDHSTQFDFHCGRAEDFGRDLSVRETYDLAVSRAVARLNILCEFAAPFIRPGGFFIAYKGKNTGDEIFASENAFKALDLGIEKTAEFNLGKPPSNAAAFATPFQKGALGENNKRVMIKIKKLKKTSTKYPRKFSDITKNPL